MNFNDYQKLTDRTAIYPGQGGLLGLNYAAMEASGEAGEIANKVKKISRDVYRTQLNNAKESPEGVGDALGILLGDEEGYLTDEQKQAIGKEVGGALYGLARVASELGLKLEDIAQQNIDILSSRLDRGVLTGSGDDR